MFRRGMSLLLAVVMVLSMVPVQAFATELTEETIVETIMESTMAETEATVMTTEGETLTEEPTEPTEETLPAETTQPTETVVLPESEVAAMPEEEIQEAPAGGFDGWAEDVEMLGSGYCGNLSYGTPGENLRWYLYSDGTLDIKGAGWMMDFGEVTEGSGDSDAPWMVLAREVFSQGTEGITRIRLPDELTWIGCYAFSKTGIREIDLPEELSAIDTYAFASCRFLKSVTFPEDFLEMGMYAFASCESLTNVFLPDSVDTIDTGAFMECDSLTEIVLPDNIERLYDTFMGCDKLKSAILPKNLEYADDVFTGCVSLESIEIPDGFEYTYYFGLEGCTGLKTVKLPDSVKYVSGFSGCTSLESINIPYGVLTISGFQDCHSLKSIELPDSLTRIYDGTFRNCYSLEEIYIPNVEQMGDEVFKNCTSLKYVVYPSCYEVTNNIFEGCTSLEEVILPEGVTDIEPEAFLGSGIRKINFPESLKRVEWNAFMDCPRLESITITQNLTHIGRSAFENCTGLQEIHFPEKTQYSIGMEAYAFANCSSLKSVEFPESVKGLNGGAFSNCDSLTRVVLPAHLKYTGDRCFAECDNLQEVVIYSSTALTYSTAKYAFENCVNLKKVYLWFNQTAFIPVGAFKNCNALETVYFLGSQEEWAAIEPNIREENAPFQNAEVLFDGTILQGTLGNAAIAGEDVLWRLDRDYNLILTGTGETASFDFLQDHPWDLYRDKIQAIIVNDGITGLGSFIFGNLSNVREVRLPSSLKVIRNDAFYGCTGLEAVHFKGSQISWDKVTIFDGNEALRPEIIHAVPVHDFFDNQNITINHRGSAIAYYQTYPDTSVIYRFRGDPEEDYTIVHSNEYGIFSVPLKDENDNTEFTGDNTTHTIQIEILRVDDAIFADPVSMTAIVKVQPLSFQQEWELSFDGKIGGALTEGGYIDVGIGSLEATAGEIGLEGTVGRALKINRGYTPTSESLELTSDVKGGVGVNVSAGVKGDIGPMDLNVIGGSAGVKFTASGTYGLKTDSYSPDDPLQQRAIGTFFLGELVMTQCQSNPAMWDLYNYLIAKNVYEACGCDFIKGGSLELEAQIAKDILSAKIKGGEMFDDVEATAGLLSGASKLVLAAEYQGSPGKNFTTKTGIATGREVNLLKGSLDLPSASSEWFPSSSEIELAYGITDEDQELSMTFLRDRTYNNLPGSLGKESLSLLDRYTFKMTSLIDYDFGSRYSDSKLYSGIHDLVQVAEAVTQFKVPVSYETSEKRQAITKLGLEFGLGAGLKLDAGLEAAYISGTEVVTSSGFLTNSGPLVSTESQGLTDVATTKKRGFLEIYLNAVKSLAKDALELFVRDEAPATEGVEQENFTVYPNEEAENLEVISTTKREETAVFSHVVQTRTPMASRFASESEDTTSRRTIGNSVLISTQRADTKEEVTDFSETPLTFRIRYSKADLEAAGLSKAEEVAMYRYSDEGDYFDYIGGIHDADAMSVTAQITKPGQYVLAADSCAPWITLLNMSDYGTNPTITVQVDDMSGLDVSQFVFMLDGDVKVDGSNIADHYHSEIGEFIYTVEGYALAEGEHSMSFTLADTTGNSETYTYTFETDLTAPEIRSTSVTGTVNAGGLVEVRADVFDRNLTGVQAVFSRQLPNGNWSVEVSADMIQLEDGTWALDYEGEGIPLKVYIQAMDIAGNKTVCDTVRIDPCVESMEIEEDYIALRRGQTRTISPKIYPEQAVSAVQWSSDNETVVTVDDEGNIKAIGAGTAYVTATVQDGDNTFTDRCRIDVKSTPSLDGIQLGSGSATVELYSTAYTTLEVLLMMPQNSFASADIADSTPEDMGAAIEEARFDDETMDKLFKLIPGDDRTLRIYPTDYAVENPKAIKGSYKGTVTLTVWGREYTSSSLTLKVKKSMPKLKVSVGAFNSFYAGQFQDLVITGATVTDVEWDASMVQPDWLTLEGQRLYMNENAPAANVSGKVYLLVHTQEWRNPVAVTLNVKNAYKAATLKLSASSVTLNTAVKDTATVTLTANPADFALSEPSFRLTDNTGKVDKTGELSIGYENGTITVGTTPSTGGNYKLFVSVGKTKEVALNIKTISKLPAVTFKVTGNPDLNIPGQRAQITPAFKNYSGSFTLAESETAQFVLSQDGKNILVSCKNGVTSGNYTLNLKLILADGSTVENPVKVTVKKSVLKLKLSASKLSLNKTIGDSGEISVTSATKGYEVTSRPVWNLMDKTGKNSAKGKLTIGWNNGKLTVSANEATEYGGTYKLLVQANTDAPTSTVTITILAENKSVVTSALKASGAIDVIRDGSAVTVTSTYKNANAPVWEEALMFYKVVGKQMEAADDLFAYAPNGNGGYTVTKAKDAQLDHSFKYQVKLITSINGAVIAESKPAALPVKQGSAKLTLNADSTTLFAKDKHSRIDISLGSADSTLNKIARVEIKDAKLKEQFAIFDYGNGQYALGFKEGKIPAKLTSVNIPLEVWLEGNETAKSNASLKVKISIVP